jgi:hypothetical protein
MARLLLMFVLKIILRSFYDFNDYFKDTDGELRLEDIRKMSENDKQGPMI